MKQMESRTIIIAAMQTSPRHGDVPANLARIAELAEPVTAEVLVLPELASTGYFFTDPVDLAPMAEVAGEGAFSRWMLDYAAARRTVVVGGFAERDPEGRLYNAALIALPDGTWRVYRKTHLFYKERMVFEPGDTGFFVVEWEGVRYGTMICYDWRFPESTRTLALRGADVVLHPSNLVAAKALWGPTMGTRSLENKVISVTANRCGDEEAGGELLHFSGESQITGMNGRPLAVAPAAEECVITAEVDPFATRNKSFNPYNDILADRRPELYL
jgi:predicted amidohydrolase